VAPIRGGHQQKDEGFLLSIERAPSRARPRQGFEPHHQPPARLLRLDRPARRFQTKIFLVSACRPNLGARRVPEFSRLTSPFLRFPFFSSENRMDRPLDAHLSRCAAGFLLGRLLFCTAFLRPLFGKRRKDNRVQSLCALGVQPVQYSWRRRLPHTRSPDFHRFPLRAFKFAHAQHRDPTAFAALCSFPQCRLLLRSLSPL
jgi:hypothetical protein